MSLNLIDKLKLKNESTEKEDSTEISSTESSDEIDYQESNLNLEGKILKNYNILYELGRGTYSIVWLAFNIEDSKFYAIKIQNSDDFEEGLEEIRILKKIGNHKHINKLINFFIHKINNDKYICSVYHLRASNLDLIVRKGKLKNGLKSDLVLKIFKQLIKGLNYLHNQLKIYHGDLKPDNILLKGLNKYDEYMINKYIEFNFNKKYSNNKKKYWLEKGKNINRIKKMKKNVKLKIRIDLHKQIMNKLNNINLDKSLKYEIDDKFLNNPHILICDFGDYCNIDEEQDEEFGTRYYRAPEIILLGDCNSKVDIWALGCTIYEILTGRILFDPSKDEKKDRNYHHLLNIVETCGNFSKKFLKNTKLSKKYFNDKYNLKYDEIINDNNLLQNLVTSSDDNKKILGMILCDTLRSNSYNRLSCKFLIKKYLE
jgi:serine/threonine protein kinase